MNRIILLPVLLAFLIACDGDTHVPDAKHTQAQAAAEAANSINFAENAEIDNIKRRLELTSDPGLLGYIVLFNDAGQPIEYTTVKGKVTSGNKRLTSPDEMRGFRVGAGVSYEVVASPSDEGTYGTSAPYIFFWTQNGVYRQWSGDYLYSDQPTCVSGSLPSTGRRGRPQRGGATHVADGQVEAVRRGILFDLVHHTVVGDSCCVLRRWV